MIRIELQGEIARLLIDRRAARNAFDLSGWRALREAAAAIPSEIRAVILASADPASFSAGADIREIADQRLTPGWPARFLDEMRAAIDAVAALPIPVIAAIDGGCFGAGVALILAADLRVAGRGARFAITPARLGLLYPAVDVARLERLVGFGQASWLLLTGDAIDADEARHIGLVEQVAEHADEAATALAARIAVNAPGAVAGLKATLRNPADPTHDAVFLAALTSDELATGLARFTERKAPK